MKKNYISDLRYSQKLKESQSFKQADSLQKKVRKLFKITPQSVFDAEKQMRQILCFWKNNWDYEHSHSVFLNPKVFYPMVTMADPQQEKNQELIKFAQMIKKLIQRLRIDQQNEVNYKIEEKKCVYDWSKINKIDKLWKYLKSAQISTQNILRNLSDVTNKMVLSVEESLKEIQQIDYCLDSEQIHKVTEIKKQLLFINRILSRHSLKKNKQNQTQMQEQCDSSLMKETQNLNSFIANTISILDQMKQQHHGPSFISVQPQIGQLTYLLHPVLWSVAALFQKQKIQIEKINPFKKLFEESIPYKQNESPTLQELDKLQHMAALKQSQIWDNEKSNNDNFLLKIKDSFKRQNQRYSKVLFLNLDGFESEYNIQLARNFNENLMYVSFPKFLSSDTNQVTALQERFYNKILFEHTRLGETFSQNEELNFLLKQQRFTKSPQQYHQNVEQLYKETHEQKNSKTLPQKIDRNQKIFIFPIKMNSLFHKNPQLLPNHSLNTKMSKMSLQGSRDSSKNEAEQIEKLSEVAQHYESHFIRFIMRRFLNSQIVKFKPSHIIISYSNRILLQDDHFVQLIQELTSLGRYKILLFPNFTTSYIDRIKMSQDQKSQQFSEKNSEQQTTNCYAFTRSRVISMQQDIYTDASLTRKGFDQCPTSLSFFNKILRFLKISSGTYNLQQSFENQSVASKLKNVKIFPYTEFLFNLMKNQYPQFGNKLDKQMMNADKMFLQQRIEEEKDQLKRCVPKLYKDLFKVLENIVIHGVHENMPLENNDTAYQETQTLPSPYTLDVRRVFEYFLKVGDKQGIKRIRNYQIQSIRKPFNEFIEAEEKQKMNCKYQEKSHLYFKIKSQKQQFQLANQMSLNFKTNDSGLRVVTFKLGKQKVLPIYKDTSIIFQTNQINKSQTFILVMNHLEAYNEQVKHYIGKINLKPKQSFSQQTCQVQEIRFYDGPDQLEKQKFKALCEWNFKQTSQFLILYWPSEYDFIKASLFKMTKQQYEPRICHDIFLTKKINCTNFYRARINLDTSAASILPRRRGCSAYEIQNRIFIFGGVYERQHNYLNLQHDIVTFDLDQLSNSERMYNQSNGMQEKPFLADNNSGRLLQNFQLTLRNVKKQLYSQQFLKTIIENQSKQIKLNSFIRPKIEIELFDAEDICTNEALAALNQDGIRTVVMIGGYGQNFAFPHSLITYFYHLIKFNTNTRQIVSIQKRNTIQKPIPINLKQPIKNKNIFQHFRIYENDALIQGLTNQDHYFFHRATYNLDYKKGDKNNKQIDYFDMSFKFLFMYATEMFNEMDRNYIRFAQKIGERRVIEESQAIKVEIVNKCNNNIFISNEDGTFLYTLNYKEKLTSIETHPLTHEAIISLDVNSNIVCSLVKHKEHTKEKCVLASEKITLPNPKFAFQNQSHFINLIKFIEFEENFDLHALFMMKRNQLIIVHGVAFSQYKVYDQIIATKYMKNDNLGDVIQEKCVQIQCPSVSLQVYLEISSFLARQNQKLFSINLMSFNSKQQQFIYGFQKYSLDMNSLNKQWKSQHNTKYLSFYTVQNDKELYLGRVRFQQIRQQSKNKLSNSICVISPSTPSYLSSKRFIFSLNKIDQQSKILYKQKQIIKIKVSQINQQQIWSKISWKKIYKNQQKYQDSGITLKLIQ